MLPIHFNAISIHMHMLKNHLESIYFDIDYPVLDLPRGFACGYYAQFASTNID